MKHALLTPEDQKRLSTDLLVSSAANRPEAEATPLFPFLDLKAQFASIRSEVLAAIEAVMDSQHFILGPEVESLENEIKSFTGSNFAVACASGSDALLLALMALGVDRNDEVITAPFTFGATAGAIARLGARPVFVDIDPESFNIDVRALARAVTAKTKAIMPVHLFGLTAEMDAVMAVAADCGAAVIEDAAQSLGASYKGGQAGTLGAAGCFSFFPSKNLGGAGDGGLIITDRADLAARLKALRVHGAPKKYQYEMIGVNSRLDALQAAILRVKLPHLTNWTDARRRNARHYCRMFEQYNLLKMVQLPKEPEGCTHVYNQFAIRVKRRDALRKHLQRCGVPTEIYYPSPLHLQPAFAFLDHHRGDFPNAEAACREALSLPIYPELKMEHLKIVVSAIAGFFSTSSSARRDPQGD
jgi:dTDP-4-amino-4,6-dideoxygalactose transaminase